MTRASLPSLWLRLRLSLALWHPVAVAAALLLTAAAAAMAWLVQDIQLLRREQLLERRMAALPIPPARPAPADLDQDNLAAFYGALGERRVAEEQVKTLFALAAKTGLVLRQGEYKPGYERNARVHTYQVTLPVSGSYASIWQFALMALRAIPFAALDDISFRRDTIGDARVEARLRLTLYLAGPGARGEP